MRIEILEKRYREAYAKVNELMKKWDVFERPQKKSYLKAKAKEERLRKLFANRLREEMTRK